MSREDLELIVRRKQKEAAERPPLTFRNIRPSIRDFAHYVGGKDDLTLIAERASSGEPDAATFTKSAQDADAYAVSIWVDSSRGGRLQDRGLAQEAAILPVLCRDVVVDDAQIYLAREHGADAIVFMVSVAPRESLRTWVEIARSMHMESVLECENEEEIDLACVVDHAVVAVSGRGRTREEVVALARRVPTQRIIIVTDLDAPGLEDVERFRGVADAWIVSADADPNFSALAEAGED